MDSLYCHKKSNPISKIAFFYIFIEAKQRACEVIEQLEGRKFHESDMINAEFSIRFNFGAFIQMAGRHRRKENENKKPTT